MQNHTIQKKALSKKTLNGIKSTANQIFKLAIEARVLDFNPAEYVVIPKNAAVSHREALTQEQQQWIIDTPHRAQRAAMIMLFAGLRRGEATALTWADIDFTVNTIRVNKSVEMVNGKPRLKSTKTEAGNRIVDAPRILMAFLEDEKRNENPLCMYVIHTTTGKQMTNIAWKRLWESYMADLNVKYGYGGGAKKCCPGGLKMRIQTFTPHCLRHTFATLLYAAGVDCLTARDQLGHTDIKTTLQIYTHLDKEHKRSSMNKLDMFLECKSNASQG